MQHRVLRLMVGMAALVGGGAWAQTPQLEGRVAPERNARQQLTGDLVLSISLTGATAARTANVQVRIPEAYRLDKELRHVRIRAVRPGAAVRLMDLNDPPTYTTEDDMPLLFAETWESDGMNVVALSALLQDGTAARKHVCDIVFTAQGRPTRRNLSFVPNSIAARDAALTLLVDNGTFASASVPLFADLDWNDRVNALDFALFAEAWRRSEETGTPLPLADLHPYSGEMDPARTLSQSNGAVNANDLAALKAAWTAFNADAAAAVNEEAR